MNGNPTANLPDNNPALSKTFEIFDKIIEVK